MHRSTNKVNNQIHTQNYSFNGKLPRGSKKPPKQHSWQDYNCVLQTQEPTWIACRHCTSTAMHR